MDRIGLKINGKWCVLPNDVSITIEEHNPLFSDSGSFSYPIELSVSQNRELFKSIDHPHGVVRPQDLDGLPFEFWFDGILLLYGSIETDEDIDIEGDKCSINLVSGNGDFKSKIEGMKCTDVPLIGDIELGNAWTNIFVGYKPGTPFDFWGKRAMDEQVFMEYTNVNVSFGYDKGFPYCNVRVCVKNPDNESNKNEPYIEYDADRPWSGVCFYVAYFLDCLFKYLGYVVKENNLGNVEDMNRLAFFTTKCEHTYGESSYSTSISSTKPYLQNIKLNTIGTSEVYFEKRKVYATNKNFPKEDVSSVVESLFNAFGVKIIADSMSNIVYVVYLRDILRDNEILDTSIKVLSNSISYNKIKSVVLTYNGGDDDTSFKYDDYKGFLVSSNYSDFFQYINIFNKNCLINTTTGNKYRVKVDGKAEDEGDINNLNAALFEVGQFHKYIFGEKDSNLVEELQIGFTPVIENDINFKNEKDGVSNEQRLAIYIDEEMLAPKKVTTVFTTQGLQYNLHAELTYMKHENYDMQNGVLSPLQTRDSGFTLGIMRGPGSEAKTEVFIENYDGNGNSAWTTVVADYAFTSDTMDAYGNRYDYNGEEEGGISNQENSISLKTHIQTAKDVGLKDENGNDMDWGIDAVAAKRGLADRFMSEYMYFLLHRKTVKMGVDTTMSQLRALSWFKQLRINNTVGRLKTRTYTITNSGVEGMAIELYTIN